MPFHVDNPALGRTVSLCIEKAWRVLVTCENGHAGGWDVEELEAKFPPAATLDAIAARVRCARCRSTEGVLTIRNDQGATQRRDLEAFARSGKSES